MLVSLKARQNKFKNFTWYHNNHLFTLESDGDSWVMYEDGVVVRDTYGHPLTFSMLVDGKHYAKTVLGHILP